MLADFCGIQLGSFPIVYLVMPLFKGSSHRVHLQGVANSILVKFDRWRGQTSFHGWQSLSC